ncbi:MAG: WD40 repeat domain-containing protein [Planctomycetota bacterium]|nr:WD40 repeat domain-containing protein [Planctomycetota bacterium]
MPSPFDPYYRWLGIPPSDQSPNHYRLLGLQLREADVEVIRDAAERQLGHLRRYLAGPTSDTAQRLIAEVSRAQAELLDPAAKRSYDSQLRRENPAEIVFQHRAGTEQVAGINPELMARLTGHGFDPLHHWLGIPPQDQPPTLYRLLGLQPFESDLDVVRAAAERQIAHIRKYSLGGRRAMAETLLRALAEARAQLLDAARKQAYDQRLGQLGSLVRRYASGAIEAPTSVPQETALPVQLEAVSDAVAASDSFQLGEFDAIPLPAAQPLPTQPRHRRRTSVPAWMLYSAGSCVVATLLLIFCGVASLFFERSGSETIAVIPRQPPVDSPQQPTIDTPQQPTIDSPQQPTIDSSHIAAPVTPQIADPIELDPPRNGNPLLDYHRLRAQLEEIGIDALIEEYQDNSSDADVQLVAQALELSKEVLREDSSQLWSQLQARTVMKGGVPLSNFEKLHPTQPYWECLTASFAQAGGPLLQTLTARPYPPLAFTADGRRLVTGSREQNQLDVWDLSTGQRLTTFSGNKERLQVFAITPDGRTVVSASTDVLNVWELETGKELRTLAYPGADIHSVVITHDGKTVVAGSDAGSRGLMYPIRSWDVETGAELKSFGQDHGPRIVTITPDGRRVISAPNRGLTVWDLADGRELFTLERYGDYREVAISPDSRLIVGRARAGLKVWDLQNGSEVSHLIELPLACDVMAFTADSSQLVTSSLDRTVRLWDVRSGTELMKIGGRASANSGNIAISPDAHTIVCAGDYKTLVVATLANRFSPDALATTNDFTNGIIFASDNRRFATINGTAIHIWDAAAGHQQGVLAGWKNHLPVAISPDGSTIAYATDASQLNGGSNATIRIWDTRSSLLTNTLAGHEQNIVGLAFSHDGRTLRSTPRSGADKFWDVATGQELPAAAAAAFPGNLPSGPDHEVVVREGALLTVQDRATPEPRIYLTIRGDHTFSAATLVVDQQTIIAVDHRGAIHRFRVLGLAGQ